jgi:hypothetical protein
MFGDLKVGTYLKCLKSQFSTSRILFFTYENSWEAYQRWEQKNLKNKSHEASYIVVEVGGTSTFVTHDVTKVEVRWAETHLKVRRAKRCPKPGGPLWARHKTGARPGQVGAASPNESPHRVGLRVPAVPTHLHSRIWSVLTNYSIQLLAQQLGCNYVFF